mmetsp:Transcript_59668/g.159668  ORF Transcript_59668/g.159668 Transcript_59668/m.159668 type:complete len:219 (+) Transcript_59668:3537-4193(+)
MGTFGGGSCAWLSGSQCAHFTVHVLSDPRAWDTRHHGSLPFAGMWHPCTICHSGFFRPSCPRYSSTRQEASHTHPATVVGTRVSMRAASACFCLFRRHAPNLILLFSSDCSWLSSLKSMVCSSQLLRLSARWCRVTWMLVVAGLKATQRSPKSSPSPQYPKAVQKSTSAALVTEASVCVSPSRVSQDSVIASVSLDSCKCCSAFPGVLSSHARSSTAL